MISRLQSAALALIGAGALAAPVLAQDYPTQPVTIVVPFSAGGPSDTVARVIAHSMGREMGQQVLVQNVGGAGGTLGSAQVAHAAPDGYNLLINHIAMAVPARFMPTCPIPRPRTSPPSAWLPTRRW